MFKIDIKTPERRQHISYFEFTPFFSASIVDFKQVNVSCINEHQIKRRAFKVNNGNTGRRCEICLKLTIKTPGR